MLRLALLLAVLVLTGCADADTSAPTGDSVASPAPDTVERVPSATEAGQAGLPERPATIEETLSIEGLDETVVLSLVEFPDIRLPFSTYVREGWESDGIASGEGEAVILTRGASSIRVFVPASDLSVQETMEIANVVADSYGSAVPLEPEGWSQGGFAFTNESDVGQVRVGSHNGVPFYVIESYPPEMGDGFVPAARAVFDQWRWADGTGL